MPEEQTIVTFKHKDKEVILTENQLDEVADMATFAGDVIKDAIEDNTKEIPGNFIHIGPKIAHQISRDIAALLRENLGDIDVAYTESEDGLSVAFTLKLSTPKNADGVKIETGINFVKERVKMGRVSVVDEKQGKLFD
ncbi:MAG TPA: hypothetical protein ENI07_17505 [Desulfobacterales bacterium]|nr:hypothetical protein [Desulfobacterales bacterium]